MNLLSFESFLVYEANKTLFDKPINKKYSEEVQKELLDGYTTLDNNFTDNSFVFVQTLSYFILLKNDNIVLFQKFKKDSNTIKLGARSKNTNEYPGLFAIMLIKLLNVFDIDYIEDDDTHTNASVKSINKILESEKIDIKVYDTFKKVEYPIKSWMNNHLWKSDTKIRYYKNRHTILSEYLINHSIDLFGEVANGLLYNLECEVINERF